MSEKQVRHPEWPEGYQDWMTLAETAEAIGVKNTNYIRTLVAPRGDKPPRIIGQKLSQGNRVKWAVDPESAAHYAANRGVFGAARHGGIRRTVVRFDSTKITMADIEAVLIKSFADNPGAIESVKKPYQYKPKGKKGKSGKSDEEQATPKEWHVATLDSLIPDTDEAVEIAEEDDDSLGL